MKIIVNRASFASAFTLAASVAPPKSPKDILQYVLIEADKTGVRLSATDTEVGMRLIVDGVEVEKAGNALLNVSRVGQIVRESNDEFLTIETTDSGIRIKGTRSKFNLATADASEFPKLPIADEAGYHELAPELFKLMVKRTILATSDVHKTYALDGVLFEFEEDKVHFASTDGSRLATMHGPAVAVDHSPCGQTIVPEASLRLMDKAVGDDDYVRLSVDGNNLVMRTPRLVFFCRLLEGRFPNWRRIIPSRPDATQFTVEIGAFNSALRQASIMTTMESRGVWFSFEEGLLTIESSAQDVGESKVELPVPYAGEPLRLKLGSQFVLDLCRVIESGAEVLCEVEKSNSPAVFSLGDFLYVVMPMGER